MLGAGVILALLGMSVVFLFLIILVAVIHLSTWSLTSQTALELAASQAEAAAQSMPSAVTLDRRKLVATISAAVAAHRAARRRGSS